VEAVEPVIEGVRRKLEMEHREPGIGALSAEPQPSAEATLDIPRVGSVLEFVDTVLLDAGFSESDFELVLPGRDGFVQAGIARTTPTQ
jgi:hypothetical protein